MKASDCKANLPVYLLTTLRKGKLVGDAGFDGSGRELAIVEWDDDDSQVQKVTYRSLLTEEEMRARGATSVPAPAQHKTIAQQVATRTPAKTKSKTKSKSAVTSKSSAKVTPMEDTRQTTIGDLIKSKLNPFQPGTRVAVKSTSFNGGKTAARGVVVNEVPGQKPQLLVVEWTGGELQKVAADNLMLETELDKLLVSFEDDFEKVSNVCAEKLNAAHKLVSEARVLANNYDFDLEDMHDMSSFAEEIGWRSSHC